jgi:TonB family protein
MFSSLYCALPKQRISCLSTSLTAHLVLLAWLLHAPAPTFVAPTAVSKGERGGSVTSIYFGGATGIRQEHLSPSLIWQKSPRLEKSRRLEQLAAKSQAGNENRVSAQPEQPAAGSPFGSLSYGSFTGPEVRPALPIVSPDPVLGTDLAATAQGDVVIEITIDDQGNIVASSIMRGLDPAIDQKVLAAVLQWRFRPATRDGIAIPSKQDVYYHFPR